MQKKNTCWLLLLSLFQNLNQTFFPSLSVSLGGSPERGSDEVIRIQRAWRDARRVLIQHGISDHRAHSIGRVAEGLVDEGAPLSLGGEGAVSVPAAQSWAHQQPSGVSERE